MGNFGKIYFIGLAAVMAISVFGGLYPAFADTVYIINNNAPNYSSGYGGGVICTEHGGICATGHYMLSTARVRYAPPRWKRPTIRERRLSEGKESVPYYYKQAYSR